MTGLSAIPVCGVNVQFLGFQPGFPEMHAQVLCGRVGRVTSALEESNEEEGTRIDGPLLRILHNGWRLLRSGARLSGAATMFVSRGVRARGSTRTRFGGTSVAGRSVAACT